MRKSDKKSSMKYFSGFQLIYKAKHYYIFTNEFPDSLILFK